MNGHEEITREYVIYKIKSAIYTTLFSGFMTYISFQTINNVDYKIKNSYYIEQKILYASGQITHEELKKRMKKHDENKKSGTKKLNLKEKKAILREKYLEQIIQKEKNT